MWTLAYGQHEESHPDTRLRTDTRSRDAGVRQELASGDVTAQAFAKSWRRGHGDDAGKATGSAVQQLRVKD